ncbi:alanine racemase [Starkeya sp. ORNL1]|uniref:alanine racemase n=1 Tax=Starkeya sp. ORNL1 TaxID=2709380 RepID=UPI00146291A0|nr:alanine racemase [Starkeya sp. ORNL1]QJP13321.1 alanine racemase [Starkeya sp. ORNL1]
MSGIDRAAIPQAEAGGILTVDLGALAANWRDLAGRVAPAECAAVVKGDAYGTGLETSAQALWDAGARTLFVALLSEGKRLRAVLPAATIYVLNGLFAGTEETYRDSRLRPVLGSLPEIALWTAFCARIGNRLPAALHVDTGMNRLGLAPSEAVGLAETREEIGFELALLMSHLACADEPGHPLTVRQLEDFRAIAALFPGVPASLANSAGCLSGPDFHFDLVRPGIALYGGRSRADMAPLRPVVTLELRVSQVRDVHAGETIGYGAAATASEPMRIAILAAGYADGIPRLAGSSDTRGGAEAIIAGRRCPLIGRISMDLMALDITALPEDAVKAGDLATLLGRQIGVDELARHGETIGYEILTSLGRRYHRRIG